MEVEYQMNWTIFFLSDPGIPGVRSMGPSGPNQCPTGRVFQHRVGSGRVLEKIPGSGSGSGRVGVLKYTIGYFRVSFLLSGISGYSWVFPGISGYIGYHLFFFR